MGVYACVPAKTISSLDEYTEKRKAAQLQEAVTMVNEYKKVYGEYPKEEIMNEYFSLFSNKIEGLNNVFLEKRKLRGNFETSSNKLLENKPKFENYEEFLNYCKNT